MAFPMIKYLTIFLGLALSALSLTGCAGFGKTLEPPRVSLADIQLEEVKAFETIFQIELRLFNTNDIPIEIKGIDCELELNGRKFGSGVSRVEKEIPSYGTDTVPITLYSSVLDMVRGVLNLPGKEKLQYKVSGHVRLSGGPFIPSAIPFKSEGEFALEAISDSPR
jgi:LEA14-like dessication related protein